MILMNMNNTTLEDLRIFTSSLSENTKGLKSTLDGLSSNYDGMLFEIKQIIGPDTDLGYSISKLETVIESAKQAIINNLNYIHDFIENTYLTQLYNSNQKFEEESASIAAAIDNINFD